MIKNTIIDWALKNIELSQGEKIDIAEIPLDDKQAFDLLKESNTKLFQLESQGMKDLIDRLAQGVLRILLLLYMGSGPLHLVW